MSPHHWIASAAADTSQLRHLLHSLAAVPSNQVADAKYAFCLPALLHLSWQAFAQHV